MIQLEGVSKIYKNSTSRAVDSVSFEVNDHEILGFVGLNGAGKTTAIKIAAGVLNQSSGRVLLDHVDMREDRNFALRNIGWVPEFPNFDPLLKASQVMRYYCGLYGLSSRESRLKSEDILQRVGLGEDMNGRLSSYSQGMKKRFLLGCAMIMDPKNYLMDETLNGLDPEGIRDVKMFILNAKNRGGSVLLSSHILSAVEELADRVAIIHKGKILSVLSRSDIASTGKPVLNVEVVGNPEKATELLRDFGDVQVTENKIKVIQSNSTIMSPDEALKLLYDSGVKVLGFSVSREKLEDLFFEIIGEDKKANSNA